VAKTRILIVDDHLLFREGLRSLLARDPQLNILGEAGDAASALEQTLSTQPDLILLDLQIPGTTGLKLTRELLALEPCPKVIILTGTQDMSFVPHALELGIAGCLRKELSSEDLLRAIQTALEGKVFLCSDAATAVTQSIRNPQAAAGQAGADPLLSERELEVLTHVSKGLRNKEIADLLGVSVKSVETYRSRLMKKLNCQSTAELLRYAVNHGF